MIEELKKALGKSQTDPNPDSTTDPSEATEPSEVPEPSEDPSSPTEPPESTEDYWTTRLTPPIYYRTHKNRVGVIHPDTICHHLFLSLPQLLI